MRGVFSELTRALVSADAGRGLRLSVKSDHPFYTDFGHVCEKNGFE